MAEEAQWNFIEDTLTPIMKQTAAVNMLRAQKKKHTVEFLPSKAYALLGHGTELPRSNFIVPPNCIIITKAFPGEMTYYENLYPMWNTLFNWKRASIYENPLCYMSEIINDFGSVMVYKPGDICPEFEYQLHPTESELNISEDGTIPEDDITPRRFVINKYGVLPIRQIKPLTIQPVIIPITIPVEEFVDLFYEESIVPNKEHFLEWFGPESIKGTLKEVINAVRKSFPEPNEGFPFFPDESGVKQSELLQINPATGKARRPGVYYNFICRSLHNTNTVYEYNSNLQKQTIKPTITSILTSNLPLAAKNILKRRILEAEQRKHFIPGSKFNRSSATARRRKSRSQRRTRKSRK